MSGLGTTDWVSQILGTGGGLMLTVGVNQPYYFPYLGYFGLIAKCDILVLYDDVEYSKASWVNRNRILTSSGVRHLSLPLEKSSDYDVISRKRISKTYDPEKQYRIVQGAYRRADFWREFDVLLPDLLSNPSDNLFDYLDFTIREIAKILDINTRIVRSSDVAPKAEGIAGKERLRMVLESLGASHYINLPGGRALYSKEDFASIDTRLGFIETIDEPYQQRRGSISVEQDLFEKRLSIIDLLANLGVDAARKRIVSDVNVAWAHES